MTTFTYPDYGCRGRHCHDEYVEHSGQECEILSELGDDERDPEVGPMFAIRFADGVELVAHYDELEPKPVSTLLILAFDSIGQYWAKRTDYEYRVRLFWKDDGEEFLSTVPGQWPLITTDLQYAEITAESHNREDGAFYVTLDRRKIAPWESIPVPSRDEVFAKYT
jgi:hypothetical protein